MRSLVSALLCLGSFNIILETIHRYESSRYVCSLSSRVLCVQISYKREPSQPAGHTKEIYCRFSLTCFVVVL